MDDPGKRPLLQRLLSADFPWMAARTASFAAMFALVALAWGRWGVDEVEVPDPLMYTNLANLLFWVAFMMGLVLLAPVLGRSWCGICPLGALNESASRWGLGRSFPARMRNDYPKAALLLLTVGLLGFGRIHHYPGATAWYLGGWMVLAAGAGAVFRGRSLCSFLCPVGGMLGLYSRLAAPTVAVRDREVCGSCSGRECLKGRDSWATASAGRLRAAFRFRRHGCAVNLKPWAIEGPGRCLLCGNCLRACPYQNLSLSLRSPLAGLWRDRYLRFSETAPAAVLTGFVLISFSRFWPTLASFLAFPATALSPLAGVALAQGIFLLWGGFLLPFLLFLLPALALRRRVASSIPAGAPAGGTGRAPFRFWRAERSGEGTAAEDAEEEEIRQADSVRGLMASFLPALVPVLMGGHLVLAVVKLNAKMGYLPLGLADPAGVRSYMAVEEFRVLPRPSLLLPLGPVKWALLVLLAACLALSLLAVSRIARREKVPAALPSLPVLAVAGVVAGGVIKWLF